MKTVILNRDGKRGHFVMTGLDGPGEYVGEITASELGDYLHLWTTAAHLTPRDARTLAEALIWWADRRDARTPEPEARRDAARPTGGRMRCPATTGPHACCRTQWHPLPHMAHDGTQWDDDGIRQARGNHPYITKESR